MFYKLIFNNEIHEVYDKQNWRQLTLLGPMETSIKLHTLKSGWSIVYLEGLQYNFQKNIVFLSLKINFSKQCRRIISSVCQSTCSEVSGPQRVYVTPAIIKAHYVHVDLGLHQSHNPADCISLIRPTCIHPINDTYLNCLFSGYVIQKAGSRKWGFLIPYHYPSKRGFCQLSCSGGDMT